MLDAAPKFIISDNITYMASAPNVRPDLRHVLASAARLQELVPDAVLVGGSAAALYAGHRASYDHGHVLADLRARFDMVLEALESEDGWATNRLVYGKIILGELGGIETGIRQLIRLRPLEVTLVEVPTGERVLVPTFDETLRIKAFLITRRNQTRDFLDVAALSDRCGIDHATHVLGSMDRHYGDQNRDGIAVSTQLARQLADPRPKDSTTTRQLGTYKGLDDRWQNWSATVDVCRSIAASLVLAQEPPQE